MLEWMRTFCYVQGSIEYDNMMNQERRKCNNLNDNFIDILQIGKIQSRMRTKTSTIKDYYISSVLPFQNVTRPKQFLKSKQFFKPEQFIWNNPHRASSRMYQYYHKYNDNYDINIKPQIQKLIDNDREDEEQQRIRRLSQVRLQTRRQFHSRQQTRKQLQSRANSRKKSQSKTQMMSNSQIKPTTSKSHTYVFKTAITTNQHPKLMNLSITEKSYQMGLTNFDQNAERIRKLVTEQLQQKHVKIRNQFKTRRQLNNIVNSRIKNQTNTIQWS